jgi:hypothetical protein
MSVLEGAAPHGVCLDRPANHSMFASLGLMSAEDVSGVLQVTHQTLATWRCKKRGPPSIKLGKKVFYLITDFNGWAQEEREKQHQRRAARKAKVKAPKMVELPEEPGQS